MKDIRCIFFLIIKACPTAGAANAHDLDGANVNVWVMETDMDAAVTAAQSHILGYAWLPQEICFAGEVTDELIEAVDEVETKNYEDALESGITAAFYGWTTKTMSPEFFEYRPLGPSLDAGQKRHN
ncbi:MAG: hypothetical protein JW902_15210 [Syntrophaceae bacterium]|nr:hypothetical protein [Syntrophaceae bacterium]